MEINMTVDIYKGKYVSAESAYNYIDVESIIRECNNLKQLAGKLSTNSKKVNYSRDYCSPSVFNVSGLTFDGQVDSCSNSLFHTADQIDDYANEILENLQKALDKKQTELNQIAMEKEKQLSIQNTITEN